MGLTDQSKQPQDTAKHLNDEDLDEEVGVGCVCDGGGRAGDADAETAEEVADADGEAAPEEREAWWKESETRRKRWPEASSMGGGKETNR